MRLIQQIAVGQLDVTIDEDEPTPGTSASQGQKKRVCSEESDTLPDEAGSEPGPSAPRKRPRIETGT